MRRFRSAKASLIFSTGGGGGGMIGVFGYRVQKHLKINTAHLAHGVSAKAPQRHCSVTDVYAIMFR